MKLKEHLSNDPGLSDELNYAHLVDDGILINKDGAFLMAYKFRGPDINSATGGELDALTSNFNRMATSLDDGWMLHVDEIRIPSLTYPALGSFPDPVSSLIDEERRRIYESEGAHYENLQFMTFVWKFPMPMVKTVNHWFVEGLKKNEGTQNLSKLLEHFVENVERCVGLLSSQIILEKLNSEDLLSFLNTCITGELLPVAVPDDGGFIDVALARAPVVGGYYPKIGDKFIRVLTLQSYRNPQTFPGWLEDICTYPLMYRFSNRFIYLSEGTAEKEIKRYQKDWNNKVKGLLGIIREAIFNKPTTKTNQDALIMSQQTSQALTDNSRHAVRFGYWSSQIVLMHEDSSVIDQAIKEIRRYIEQKGFNCLEEKVNAMDAWIGSIPGHGSANVRRMFISSENLGHMLPLHTVWSGALFSASASLLPPHSPPVFYAATTGKTPFRFHADVSDVGHALILGPTGSGKTTLLGFFSAQFLRYADAQIFIFDKDESHKALTYALGGYYYDLGNADSLSFCPLSDLSTESRRMRAGQFIENLVCLQNVAMTPDIRAAIHTAIKGLAYKSHEKSRNLTVLCAAVQHHEVRDALRYYTLEGQMPMLDATDDTLKTGHLQTFEMGWLLSQKPDIYLPVLMYIFDQIENRLEAANGQRPTLVILEESWLYIGHPFFANKLRDWLKTLRKKNARVIFATQSLSDLYDPSTQSLTSVTAAIMESCPTKIYLPHPTMEAEMFDLYKKMGLNDRQIELIAHVGIPKRHYYVVTPEGNRLIDLGFSDDKPMALSFIGLSKKKSHALIETFKKYGNTWVYHWLNQNDFEHWAAYWKKNYEKGART